ENMLKIIKKHIFHLQALSNQLHDSELELVGTVLSLRNRELDSGSKYGIRNAQVSCCAPTGTIGLMMDCDTTGCEPELALVKYKTLVDGGKVKYVNQTIKKSLSTLGYTKNIIDSIIKHITDTGTIEGSALNKEHL